MLPNGVWDNPSDDELDSYLAFDEVWNLDNSGSPGEPLLSSHSTCNSSAGSAVTNAAYGNNNNWSDPTNVLAQDGVLSVVSGASEISSILRVTGFSFNIPSESTILGVTVSIHRRTSDTNEGSTVDDLIRLTYNGSDIGDNKASATPWTDTLSTVSYGGTEDNWGASLTPSIINHSTFGIDIAALVTDNNASIDYVEISVCYQEQVSSPLIPINGDVSHTGGWFNSDLNAGPYYTYINDEDDVPETYIFKDSVGFSKICFDFSASLDTTRIVTKFSVRVALRGTVPGLAGGGQKATLIGFENSINNDFYFVEFMADSESLVPVFFQKTYTFTNEITVADLLNMDLCIWDGNENNSTLGYLNFYFLEVSLTTIPDGYDGYDNNLMRIEKIVFRGTYRGTWRGM